eukprot:COSAG02_NODE_1210_length_13856_cov_12.266182_8_plen_71_part_00
MFLSGREASVGLRTRCVKCGSRRLLYMAAYLHVCLLYIIMRVTCLCPLPSVKACVVALRQPQHVRSAAYH